MQNIMKIDLLADNSYSEVDAYFEVKCTVKGIRATVKFDYNSEDTVIMTAVNADSLPHLNHMSLIALVSTAIAEHQKDNHDSFADCITSPLTVKY